MKEKEKETRERALGTFPLTDVKEVADESNVTIPKEENVKDAKDWVDENRL